MFGGFAAYFYVNPDFPAALGMDEVRMILAVLGGSLALLAVVGMLMTASNSPGFGKFVLLPSCFIWKGLTFYIIVPIAIDCGNGIAMCGWSLYYDAANHGTFTILL